jgi:hypothetical protein
VLPQFFTLSSREAKEITAVLLPVGVPPLRDTVTVVRVPSIAPAMGSSDSLTAAAGAAACRRSSALAFPLTPSRGSAPNLPHANPAAPDEASAPVAASRPSFEVEPLTAALRRLHITVSQRLLDKLDAARDALSHSHAGPGEVPVQAGIRNDLRLHPPGRAPPPRRIRARRGLDRREARAALQGPQRFRGARGVRGRPHEQLHEAQGADLLRAGRGVRAARVPRCSGPHAAAAGVPGTRSRSPRAVPLRPEPSPRCPVPAAASVPLHGQGARPLPPRGARSSPAVHRGCDQS